MSIDAVGFGQANFRPYGFDPEKGMFTPEQAKKDFRPGIYDPEAREKVERNKKIITGILAVGVVVATALFLKKTDMGQQILKKSKDFLKNLFKSKPELRTKIPSVEAAANREYALQFAKNEPKTLKIHSLSKNGGEVNVNYPELIGAARRDYMDFWKNADLSKVAKRADVVA